MTARRSICCWTVSIPLVTETMTSSEARERELSPLMAIHDNYEKFVITMNSSLDTNIDGIRIINALDFLLSGEA